MLNSPLPPNFNDPRIESIEQFFPATVESYALYADNAQLLPKSGVSKSGFSKTRIHFWAKVNLVVGGTAFVGLTLYDMQEGTHAEQTIPTEFFVRYTDDPTA